MSVEYYARLLAGGSRIEAFRRGVEEAVREGDRVLDLGTGLGTFALFAARAGAARVWAVDADPVVHLARSVARANGLDGRIEFLRGRAPEVKLPGAVDVLVFEDFPTRFLSDATVRLLRRVRREVLAPEARTVPRAGRLCLAPLRGDGLRDWLFPLDEGGDEGLHGLDWRPVRPYLANLPRGTFVGGEAVAGEPAVGARLPLLPPPGADALTVEGAWSLAPGPVHALALWFDLEVWEGGWISNRPGPEVQPWGQLVLPLDPPLRPGPGERLQARVGFDELSDGAPGWLSWKARCGQAVSRGHELAGSPGSLEDLYPGGQVPEPGPGARDA